MNNKSCCCKAKNKKKPEKMCKNCSSVEYTVITCNQAIYGIAFALHKQLREDFSSVVLHLGGFHMWHIFMKAITNIIRVV